MGWSTKVAHARMISLYTVFASSHVLKIAKISVMFMYKLISAIAIRECQLLHRGIVLMIDE